jgi:hypothetical protein
MFGRAAPSIVLALVLIASNAPADDRLQHLAGRPLAEVLAILQGRGLQTIYSTALIHDNMLVKREPRATTPRGILEEIVAPHGLQLRDGPGGTLLIVPAERTPPEPAPLPVFLHEIIVTPSHTRIVNDPPDSRQTIAQETIRQIPHLADDLYRAVKQLPGASGSVLSAKNFFNVFPTIDSTAIAGVDLMTGRFHVEYGHRMSGVMDIAVETLVPLDRHDQRQSLFLEIDD